uniref:OmpA family protein n=1 Tax=Vibrio ziniensis TaxID=2711221 RepID=A0A6G7CM21_9VIBR|nr:OmpA family protein [Vibrio ziniensis]
MVPFDEVQWNIVKFDDVCQLTVDDIQSGVNARFEVVAGNPLALIIGGRSINSFANNMVVETEAPVWGSGSYESTMVNQFERKKTSAHVVQGVEFIYRDIMMGAWLTVRDDFHSVTFPTANMGDAFESFQICTTALPPVGFQEAQTTVFEFKSGALALTKQQRQQLAEISELVKFDKRIKKVLISGHSDSHGDMATNLSISKRRANDVAYWMMLAGVPEQVMETRGHGSRYPIATNNTAEGRDMNRRVEVELVRK